MKGDGGPYDFLAFSVLAFEHKKSARTFKWTSTCSNKRALPSTQHAKFADHARLAPLGWWPLVLL